MIKIIFTALLFTGLSASSQKCEDLYYFQNSKIVEMTITNKKSKDTLRNTYSMSDVKRSGGTISSTVNSELTDSKSKTLSKATTNIKCTGGVFMIDLKMFIPSAQQERMGTVSSGDGEAYLEYPSNMKEGDVLKDGQLNVEFKMQSGIKAQLIIDITKRKVEGKESVTTPAGTWNCFRITYHSKVAVKIGIGIPVNTDVTEWFAPGFGIVKNTSGSGSAEVTSIK